MGSSSGLPPAPLSFEQQNTLLPDVLSLTPYFESSSLSSFGKLVQRIVTAPPVHSLILRPFGWFDVKTTLIMNTAMM